MVPGLIMATLGAAAFMFLVPGMVCVGVCVCVCGCVCVCVCGVCVCGGCEYMCIYAYMCVCIVTSLNVHVFI